MAQTDNIQVHKNDDIWDRMGEWYESKSKFFNILLILFVLAVAAWKVYSWQHANKVAKASVQYGSALEKLETGVRETDEARRKDALTGAISEAERLSNDYPGLFAGRQATLLLGNAHYYLAASQKGADVQKSLKAAQDAYNRYISTARDDKEKAAGYLALGNALENLVFVAEDANMVKEATDAYKQAQQLAPNSYISAEAKLSMGRLLQGQKGKENEALSLYYTVAEERKPTTSTVTAAAKDGDDKPYVADNGAVFTPEQLARLRNFTENSQSEAAHEAMLQLQSTARK